VSDKPLRVRETGPRPGDTVGCYTRTERAREMLGWTARFTLEDAIRHSLQWSPVRDALLR